MFTKDCDQFSVNKVRVTLEMGGMISNPISGNIAPEELWVGSE
jgi:hypothetical protein